MPRDPKSNLELELQEEKVATLARIGNKMDEALRKLREFEVTLQGRPSRPDDLTTHEELLVEAAEKVWFYVVQRDSIGLVESPEDLRERGVPAEVIRRMGPRRAR